MGGHSYLEMLYREERVRISKLPLPLRLLLGYRPLYFLSLDLLVYLRLGFIYVFPSLHLDLAILYYLNWYMDLSSLTLETSLTALLAAIAFSWFHIRYIRPLLIPFVRILELVVCEQGSRLVDYILSLLLELLWRGTKLSILTLAYLLATLLDYSLSSLLGFLLYPTRTALTFYGLDRLRHLRPFRFLANHILGHVYRV